MTNFTGTKPHGRPRSKDTQHTFVVRYADGRSAYIRVDPKAADYGNAPILAIARAKQGAGEIPDGDIDSVQKVR
jgi:hypothetical protein